MIGFEMFPPGTASSNNPMSFSFGVVLKRRAKTQHEARPSLEFRHDNFS
jgi:hypothetical protein